jgi:hypothetical protein
VAEAERRLSAREETELELLETIEPWGEKRADFRAARICETIARANGSKADFDRFLKLFDFEPRKEQTPQESEEILEAAAKR